MKDNKIGEIETKEIKLYRVEKENGNGAMWYTEQAEYEFDLEKVRPSALAIKYPMGFDKRYSDYGKAWHSSCCDLNDMLFWFTKEDAEIMLANGYKAYCFVSKEYRKFPQETIFTREGCIDKYEISLMDLYK